MAVEIPMDAIKQLQISLRKQANMSSYDPDDDTPSPNLLPSPEETISELDPSPPYLRCKKCKGRLLRGVASLVCVFCGGDTCSDLPPDPINFKNTFGYQWLLTSLALTGSEIVDLPGEVKESNSRGQAAATKDELSLSEILNVEIRWTSKSEKSGTGDGKTPARPKSFMDLAGVNLDNFFTEGEKDAALKASYEEAFDPSKGIAATESSGFQGGGNLSFFASEELFESSKQVAIAESSAFQGGGNLSFFPSEESSESSKQVVTTESGDFQGSGNQSYFASDVPFESSEQTESTAFQGRGSLNLFPSEVLVEPSKEIATRESNASQDHRDLSLFENVPPSEIAVQSTQGEIGDSVSSWPASFQSAASATQISKSIDPFVGSTDDLSVHLDTVFGSIGTSTNEKTSHNAFLSNDWFSNDLLTVPNDGLAGQPQQFESLATVKNDRVADNANDMFSSSIDWGQETQWQTTSDKHHDKKSDDEDDDSFGTWNDFTSSSSAQKPSSASKETLDQTPLPTDKGSGTNLFSTASNSQDLDMGSFMQPVDIYAGDDDSFGTWNDFASLSTTQNPSISSKQPVDQMTSPADKSSGTNLFSTTSDSQDLDFSSFMQPDISAGEFSSSHGSSVMNIMQPGASVLDRIGDAGTTDEEVAMDGGDALTAKVGSKLEDVEKIMSQMHDLSFMLESNLSIPPKRDGHSLSQDHT